MKICDLHTHVLPGVDDGAGSMETALEMIENAAASDVTCLVATPHWYPETGDRRELFSQTFRQLKQAARHIPVELYLGAEVGMGNGVPACLEQGHGPTINGSRYLLTEFPGDLPLSRYEELLARLLAAGYVPLIAHPERYAAVCAQPMAVERWLDMGCHLQITGGSLRGTYGKTVCRTAELLLQQDFVACVASDAHGVQHRSNFLLDVYDHLAVNYSREYAQVLMYENPMRICRDESL